MDGCRRDAIAARLGAVLPALLALLAACPRQVEGQRADDLPPAPGDVEQARGDGDAQRRSQRGWRCDGDLGFADIPDTPLSALVAGKRLKPVAQAARGSIIGQEIAFDFANPPRGWDPQRPCFIPESPLFAGFKRVDPAYVDELALPPGHYRLGPGWQAYYGQSAAEGRAVLQRPEFYGLLILEATSGLQRKPEQMFAPTGRARGRVAICFKDRGQSWIAGAFDVPVCGDARARHGDGAAP